MKKSIIIFAALAALACTSAFATKPGNNGGGQGGCGAGQTTNGCGTTVATGGQGGAGGNAVAGAASSASASARAEASSKQAQGQVQGQLQGQQQAAISGGNTIEGNRTAVTVEGDTYQAAKNPVATAYAAPLTASNGTCMGSTSVGGQGVTIGLSLGTTWTDSSCDMRYDAEALRAAGQPAAAVARLCQKPEIAEAMKAAGTPCPAPKTASASATPATQQAEASQVTYQDPIIRRRLGLPPL